MRADATDWNWADSISFPEALCKCICIRCVSKRMRRHLYSANSRRKMKTKINMQTVGLILPTGKMNPHFFFFICNAIFVGAEFGQSAKCTIASGCVINVIYIFLAFPSPPKRDKTKILFSVRLRATCNWHNFHRFLWFFSLNASNTELRFFFHFFSNPVE